MSHDFQRELAWLGAASSPAFVRAPEGNGCAERLIRTLKESLLWVRTFATVEELRLALLEFRQTYNERWLIERHGHHSPAQFRRHQIDRQPIAAQLQTSVPRTGGGTSRSWRQAEVLSPPMCLIDSRAFCPSHRTPMAAI